MIFNRYPYTDFHEMNLDTLLEMIKKLAGEMEDFKVINKITFYGEWDITNQYPAWAIVDDNGNGYISIKPVPAGVPLSDGNYWVLVADYSALYANITSRIVALENTVGDNSSGLVKAVNDLNSDVTALQNDVTALQGLYNLADRNIMFIEDSYGARKRSDNKYLYEYVADVTGAYTEMIYQNGAGCVNGMFETLVNGYAGDASKFDTVVLIGGANDQNKTESAIVTAMGTLLTSIKTKFDKALTIIIMCPGITFASSPAAPTRETTWKAYRAGALANGAAYIENSQYILRNTDLLDNDKCHPNGKGVDYLSLAAVEMLYGRSVNVYYELDCELTMPDSTTITYRMKRFNNLVTLIRPYGGFLYKCNNAPVDASAGTRTDYGTFDKTLIDATESSGYSDGSALGKYENNGSWYDANCELYISNNAFLGFVTRFDSADPASGSKLLITSNGITIIN